MRRLEPAVGDGLGVRRRGVEDGGQGGMVTGVRVSVAMHRRRRGARGCRADVAHELAAEGGRAVGYFGVVHTAGDGRASGRGGARVLLPLKSERHLLVRLELREFHLLLAGANARWRGRVRGARALILDLRQRSFQRRPAHGRRARTRPQGARRGVAHPRARQI